ncbi:MAG TPA: thiamine pyrophosphate-dependent dehydrogenase E1 component subunit alpha [Stellaceae bacterium]|nr:thiamine pyrophosphate-dependent dehydrogenase E1 component subunit alpha [Stellaceae bacterium]
MALHRELLRIRSSEETIAARYKDQEMRTPTHLGTGQEAVAVGVCQALRLDDVVFSHHRCHNHFLAKGGSVFQLASELYGRATGCSGGRGGSVHLTDRERGVVFTSAILGEASAVATGAALSFQMDGGDRVAVTFFGEGSMDEGAIYECLNYAAIKRLPVLYVCENNLYATETRLDVRQAPGSDLCERARSFRLTAERIDGNDIVAVLEASQRAVDQLRRGEGPVFLECMTYRWREHVGPYFDHELDRTYRSQQEVEEWIERCPIKRSGERLVQQGLATRAELDVWAEAIQAEVTTAFDQARQAPWPEVSTLFDFV